MSEMTDQHRGPIFEYMMGTFDMNDQTWMGQMNQMMNSYGMAGWRRSAVTLISARYLLIVMERSYPAAEAEIPTDAGNDVRDQELLGPPEPIDMKKSPPGRRKRI
jgi:hypothetical protein